MSNRKSTVYSLQSTVKSGSRKAVVGRHQQGQSLMELVVVVAVIVIVVGALVFATIASLRNAQFAKNQAQATKLAQEGLEKVRTGRDRNDSISGFTIGTTPINSWQNPDMWSNQINGNCGDTTLPTYCYFKFTSTSGGAIQYIGVGSSIPSLAETIPNTQFKRVIILSDSSADCDLTTAVVSCYTVEKTVTVLVVWTDFSGEHESRLTTILRRL